MSTPGNRAREEPIESLLKDGHPAYPKSKIFDQEDHLRHQRMIRAVIQLWLIIGNILLLGGSAVLVWMYGPVLTLVVTAGALLLVSVGLGLYFFYRQYERIRTGKLFLRKLHQVRKERLLEEISPGDEESLLATHKRYREETPEVVEAYREESNKYRRTHNIFQGITIVGSIAISTLATAAVSQESFRWVTVAISLIVGISAGFTGYFKYRERSFSLQQTADSIERQYYSVDLRVGRYRGKSEAVAYADFAHEVVLLREEQSKRQQQLEQPAEVKQEQ